MQIDINKLPGPIDLIWICTDCISKTRVCKEIEQQNTDMAHGLEEAGKIMELLAELGFAIDKAKKEYFKN